MRWFGGEGRDGLCFGGEGRVTSRRRGIPLRLTACHPERSALFALRTGLRSKGSAVSVLECGGSTPLCRLPRKSDSCAFCFSRPHAPSPPEIPSSFQGKSEPSGA